MTLQTFLSRLPERFRWTLHNVVAHPLSELLYQIGLGKWADDVHDATVPPHDKGMGRG